MSHGRYYMTSIYEKRENKNKKDMTRVNDVYATFDLDTNPQDVSCDNPE